MNDVGSGAYPTTKQLAEYCSLSERAICTHIQNAVDAGWLVKKAHGFGGQKWKNHEYEAQWPSEFGDGKGTELGSAAFEKALNVIPKGTEPDDKKALNEVQSNVSYNIPINEKDKKETPRSILEAVLSPEIADGVIQHRMAMRKKLTPLAAKRLASKFAKWADPDEAAATMVERGWQGFEPEWMKRANPQIEKSGRDILLAKAMGGVQ